MSWLAGPQNSQTLTQVHSLASPDYLPPLGLVLTLPRLQLSLTCDLHQITTLLVSRGFRHVDLQVK